MSTSEDADTPFDFLVSSLRRPKSKYKSPWSPPWLNAVEVIGPYQIPVLQRCLIRKTPALMTAFTRPARQEVRVESLVHGYVSDQKLARLAQNPTRYINQFSEYMATIAPDFSLLAGMALHERILSIWLSRAVAAHFQSRGLRVIPTLRWSDFDDLELTLTGLPTDSTIAFSSQGIARDNGLMDIVRRGLPDVLEELKPSRFIAYGDLPRDIYDTVSKVAQTNVFPTDISRTFSNGGE